MRHHRLPRKKQAFPNLIKGLIRLEYRGYDSAGVALIEGHALNILKKKGKVAELHAFGKGQNTRGHIGIGHTRWATNSG